MAICKSCGKVYSRWTAPVGGRGACFDCFEWALKHEGETRPPEEVAPPETAAPAKKRNTRIQFSSFLPRSRSKVVFALVMASYSWALSSIIVYWRYIAGVENPGPTFYGAAEDAIGEIFVSLVFAPILETLILVGVFELVRRAGANQFFQILLAAVVVSLTHLAPWWPHAVIVLPHFCIDAGSYLYWRRTSRKTAYWVVVLIHALSNLIPAFGTIAGTM